jgi:group II intron reverse transcriptase/maturase
MQRAETVLGIIRERGTRGLPLNNIYRQLFNPDLYLRAYAKLYPNDGAMTRGITTETVDRMALAKIEHLIDEVRHERYRWTPVKRVYILKKNGKRRPLGLPTWSDKLLQEVVRQILEAFYEPQFSPHSHGFRPERGCHTALSEVADIWTGTKWFLEGDIKGCYDNINHEVWLSILAERIHDQRFLRLIRHLLQAGYLEDWRYHKTLSGSPQGSVVSPVLSNIYLDRLDTFIETTLLPTYTQGKMRRLNPPYGNLYKQIVRRRKRGKKTEARKLYQQLQRLPSGDPNDPNYRRLVYCRYADDFLLGFAGPKAEAEEIKRHIGQFLRDHLKLELSEDKTLITHAQTETARFLGYELAIRQENSKQDQRGHRNINGRIELRVPLDVVQKKCALYMRAGKPIHRAELLQEDDFTIISRYQSEYRGLVQYYLLARNVSWLGRLHWIMRTSLLKTLAAKHKTSRMEMLRRYQTTIQTPHGTMKCLEITVERGGEKKPLVARFGGIPLRRQKRAVIVDQQPIYVRIERNELIRRLLADQCEVCGIKGNCQVHHIRKLADLKVKGQKEKPLWVQMMGARRRKTLIVCHQCHHEIHAGRYDGPTFSKK